VRRAGSGLRASLLTLACNTPHQSNYVRISGSVGTSCEEMPGRFATVLESTVREGFEPSVPF
jgi:hypothetical protein